MAASVVSFNSTAVSATTPQSVSSLSWNEDDVIVVVSDIEGANSSLGAPTNANLTFTARQTQDNGSANDSEIRAWTAKAGSTQSTQTVQATRSAGSGSWRMQVWVLRGVDDYTGGWANLNESATAYNPSAGSVIIYAHSDWNATAAGRTPETNSGTVTERIDSQASGIMTTYACEWVGVNAGSDNWGVTSYSGMQIAQLGLEITEGAVLSTELEGFRFEKDNAAEGGDWWAVQDTNPTGVDGAFGLRCATVFTNDPGSASFKIAGYRRVGDTFWDGPPT